MRAKSLSKRKLLIAGLAAVVVCSAFVWYFISYRSARPVSSTPLITQVVAPPKVTPPLAINLPVRLKIPSIGLDAAVEYMGLTPGGAMDTTKGPANVGWYKLGQRPGEVGSAVITGHFGWKNNLPAAFDNLHALQPGDVVATVDDRGLSTDFIVRELKQYDKNDDTATVFGSSDGKSHLNLITCEGKWSNTSKSYSNRLVVFADKK